MSESLPPLIQLSTIVPQPLQWLWRPRLPAGRLSLLVGHPDRGKSVVACTITAHVSQGIPWPDGQPCALGNVFFFEAEDHLEETVVPRLMAAGADLTKVFTHATKHLLHLPTLCTTYAPRLIIVSPLNTYLPIINSWKDHEVRRALQPLTELAATTGACVLGIMHPPKSKQAIPIHAVVGSVAFGAVARSVLTVERGEDGLYLLEGTKGNLTGIIPPIGYSIQSWTANRDIAHLRWQPVPSHLSFLSSPDDQSELSQACSFVRTALSHGPLASTKLKEAADKNGIAWRTIERARKVLQVQATITGNGRETHWQLSLLNGRWGDTAK